MAAVPQTFTTYGQSSTSIWVSAQSAFSPIFIPFTSTYVEIIDQGTTKTEYITSGVPVPSAPNSATDPAVSSAVSSAVDPAVTSDTVPIQSSAVESAASDSITAATGSSIASSASVQSNGSSHISTGALVGAAVGCAIGGLILGLVAAWLLLRRRQPAASPESSKEASHPDVVASPSLNGDDGQLDRFLLDAMPDRNIRTELQALGDLVDQHVEGYYHSGPTTSVSALSRCLAQLGFTRNAEAVATMCSSPDSRQAGLRHVISQVIFRSIDVHSRSQLSMLPAPLAAFLQSIPEGKASGAASNNPLSLALSKWRRLSAFLLHPNPSDRAPLPIIDSVVTPQAASLATALNTFLFYFVEPSQASRDAQTNHLEGVIIECTKLGYVLLSQPQDWQFVFETTNRSDGVVVVCPGLDKFGGAERTARRVVEPYTARLGTSRRR
ncbi:hypothetical protein BGZ63DRAFT_455633 [Mariannaea sp. PMI_226]|nr:hypothetical protein BGZ63DRAFT_455633 [Mariannaea sp. PMI_226]